MLRERERAEAQAREALESRQLHEQYEVKWRTERLRANDLRHELTTQRARIEALASRREGSLSAME